MNILKWLLAGSNNIGNTYAQMNIKERLAFCEKGIIPERLKKGEK